MNSKLSLLTLIIVIAQLARTQAKMPEQMLPVHPGSKSADPQSLHPVPMNGTKLKKPSAASTKPPSSPKPPQPMGPAPMSRRDIPAAAVSHVLSKAPHPVSSKAKAAAPQKPPANQEPPKPTKIAHSTMSKGAKSAPLSRAAALGLLTRAAPEDMPADDEQESMSDEESVATPHTGTSVPSVEKRQANGTPTNPPSAQATNFQRLRAKRAEAARLEKRINYPHCPQGMRACPAPSPNTLSMVPDAAPIQKAESWECMEMDELVSCGGCTSDGTGQDCTKLPGVDGVGCEANMCVTFTCQPGYTLKGPACVKS